MKVVMYPDPVELAAAAAERLRDLIAGPESTIGLAGGSTPGATYRRLAQLDVPWERTELWLSDERWVPPDHPESNGSMAATALAGVPATLLRPRFGSDPAASAYSYEQLLRDHVTPDRYGVVLLGMGTDGHTASLFPGTAALESDLWFVENWIPQLEAYRLTATPRMISEADLVIVLVSGAAKSAVLADVLEGPADRYPISFVRELDSVWLVDEAAAERLTAFTIE